MKENGTGELWRDYGPDRGPKGGSISRIVVRGVRRGRVQIKELSDEYTSGQISGDEFDIGLTVRGDELHVMIRGRRSFPDVSRTIFFEGDLVEYGKALMVKLMSDFPMGEVDQAALMTLVGYRIEEVASELQRED